MWIILGLLFSLPLMALESFERLKDVKILRALDQNIVLINRGLEDGIMIQDHAQLIHDNEGFIARGICLKSKNQVSYWKLYRIPYAQKISKDMTYILAGIADKEIPDPLMKLRSGKIPINDPKDIPKEATSNDPFSVKEDLPQKLTERDLIETVSPEQKKLFIERALDQGQMRRDLRDFKVSVFASPFTRQSINEAETYRYGLRAGNVASKYRLLGQFEQQQSKLKDPVTKNEVSTRATSGQGQFVIHRLTENFSSLSLVNYNSQRFSQLATPKSHWQFGPLGFTWHLFENKTWEYFDISYIPLYDIRTTEIRNRNTGDIRTQKISGVRHGFRLGVKTKINERVAFENLLWVRPFQDPASWRIESDNLNLSNDLKFIFNLTGNLFFDYNLIYQHDKLWKTQSQLSSSNTINSLNLRYDFGL